MAQLKKKFKKPITDYIKKLEPENNDNHEFFIEEFEKMQEA
jgi:hypothetical protein